MNECKDANQTNLAMRGLKWLTSLVNQMALVAALVLFCAFCVALIAQLFFGHRLHLKPPWGCDVVGKGVVLGLLLILLLAATFLAAIASFTLRFIILLPGQWHFGAEVMNSMLWCLSMGTYALALLRGEQLTRFAQSLCWQFCSR